MTTADLPLLRWASPAAEIIPFPAGKRIGKIRRTAQLVTESTDRAATAHWNRTVADITRQMERAGIPAERVAQELKAYTGAVLTEATRLSRGSIQSWPDGGDAA